MRGQHEAASAKAKATAQLMAHNARLSKAIMRVDRLFDVLPLGALSLHDVKLMIFGPYPKCKLAACEDATFLYLFCDLPATTVHDWVSAFEQETLL